MEPAWPEGGGGCPVSGAAGPGESCREWWVIQPVNPLRLNRTVRVCLPGDRSAQPSASPPCPVVGLPGQQHPRPWGECGAWAPAQPRGLWGSITIVPSGAFGCPAVEPAVQAVACRLVSGSLSCSVLLYIN